MESCDIYRFRSSGGIRQIKLEGGVSYGGTINLLILKF